MSKKNSYDSVLKVAAAHDAFLVRINSKINSLEKISLGNGLPRSDTAPELMKPLSKRKLPLLAKRFRKQKYADNFQNGDSDKVQQPAEEPPETLNPSELPPNQEMQDRLQSVTVHSLSPGKLTVNLAEEPAEIIQKPISVIEVKEEREFERTVKPISIPRIQIQGSSFIEPKKPPMKVMKEFTPLEIEVLERISNRSIWDVELLESLVEVVDPVFQADRVADSQSKDITIDPTQSDSVFSREYSTDYRIFEWKELANYTTPTFILDKTTSKSKKPYNIVKKTQSYSSILETQLPPQIPARPRSQQVRVSERAESGGSCTRIHRSMCAGSTEIFQPSLTFEDDETDSLLHFGWNSNVDGFNLVEEADQKSDKSVDANEQVEPQDRIGDRIESRCSSARSTNTMTTQKYVPSSVGVLGGLGPDKNNDDYILKMERMAKRKAYAESLRKKAISKTKSNTKRSTSTSKHPKPLILPELNPQPNDKRDRMKQYASNIKKPALSTRFVKSTSSIDKMQKLPPIPGIKCKSEPSSPMMDLKKMELEHLEDMKRVECIKFELLK